MSFKSNIDNSKKIRKGINEIIYNKNSKASEGICLDDNSSIITDQNEVAYKSNKFYTNVDDKLVLNETDPGEVATLIHKVDVSKSRDIYGINA